MAGPERALARIRPRAIEHNCGQLSLAAATGGAELCAVVKADAYGHGDHHAARAARAGGAAWLAVATAAEAADLRRHGLDGRILVMGALTDGRPAYRARGGRRRGGLAPRSSPPPSRSTRSRALVRRACT